MTITIDFNKPATTDNYATGFVPNLQANTQALGAMLDPNFVGTVSNAPSGTKRFSTTSNLFEQWNGTAWAALATGYARLDGSAPFTGDLSLGVARNTWTLAGYRAIEFGAQGTGLYGGGGAGGDMNLFTNAHYQVSGGWTLQNNGSATLYESVSGQHIFSVSTGGTAGTAASFQNRMVVDTNGITTPSRFTTTLNSECFRAQGDSAYLAGWNGAASTRTGYIQFNTGASVVLAAENGALLNFSVGGTGAAVFDTSRNFVMQPLSSYIGHNGTTGGITIGSNATLVDGTARIEMYDVSHASLPKQVAYRGDVMQWTKAAAATSLMTLDGTSGVGQLSVTGGITSAGAVYAAGVAGFLSTTYAVNAQNPIWRFGNAITYGLSYFQGTSGLDGANDSLGFHFGTATAAGSTLVIAGTGPKKGIIVNGAATTLTSAQGSTGGGVTINAALSNVQTITLTSNMTGLTLSNMQDGQTINIQITQDATGSRTMTGLTNANGYRWPGGVAGVLSTAANAVDLLCITKIGSVALCTLSKGFA